VKDLLVTTHTPVLGSGRAVRTYGIARALAARGALTLLYVRFGAIEPDAAFQAIPGVELRRGRALARPAAHARLRGRSEGGNAPRIRPRRFPRVGG